MFVLVTYDVDAKRTNIFRKLLRRYLHHEQYSVFTGDLADAEFIRMRKELSRAVVPGDRVTIVISKNRHNIDIQHMVKGSVKGEAMAVIDRRHKSDFDIL